MGCASSNPLVDGGKNLMDTAKETANDMVHKGEQAMHEVGETAIDGLTSGMDHIKGAMESAENSLGTMVSKISDTFNGPSEILKDTEQNAEDTLHANIDHLNEAISEAETIIAAEADLTTESADIASEGTFEKVDAIEDQLGETVEPMVQMIEETLHIEDMETPITTPEPSSGSVTRENGVNTAATDADEEQQELCVSTTQPFSTLPPELTPWEAAADAILEQTPSASVEITDQHMERAALNEENTPPKDDRNFDDSPQRLFNDTHKDIDDFIDKDCEGLIIDKLSIKSYKSEI